MSLTRAIVLGICLISVLEYSTTVEADVAKQVHLVVKSGRLIASNIRTSRFHTFKLSPQEKVSYQDVGNAVILVLTNKRIIAYGAISGWREMDLKINETISSTEVEDYGALVVTNKRMVNFNGKTGAFGRTNLPIGG